MSDKFCSFVQGHSQFDRHAKQQATSDSAEATRATAIQSMQCVGAKAKTAPAPAKTAPAPATTAVLGGHGTAESMTVVMVTALCYFFQLGRECVLLFFLYYFSVLVLCNSYTRCPLKSS